MSRVAVSIATLALVLPSAASAAAGQSIPGPGSLAAVANSVGGTQQAVAAKLAAAAPAVAPAPSPTLASAVSASEAQNLQADAKRTAAAVTAATAATAATSDSGVESAARRATVVTDLRAIVDANAQSAVARFYR